MLDISYNIKSIRRDLDSMEVKIIAEKELLEKELKSKEIKTAMQIKSLRSYPNMNYTPDYYHKVDCDKLLEECEFIKSENVITAAHNKKASENNTLLRHSIIEELVSHGLPRHEKRIPKGKRAAQVLTSTWIMEIYAHIPVTYDINPQSRYDNCVKEILKIKEYKLREEKKKQALIEENERKVSYIRKSTVLSTKYGLPIDSTRDDILRVILSKDKYLKLADGLQRVRHDWSDGCEIAKYSIEEFDKTLENSNNYTEDSEISSCIWNIISDFDDGRQFRDCEWGYNRLFELVDTSLLNDYNEIIESLMTFGEY